MRRFTDALVLLLCVTLALPPAALAQSTQGPRTPLPEQPVRQVFNSLPDLGSTANAAINRAEETQVGRQMVRDLRNQNALLDDAETADYLQSLASRIGIEAQDGEQRISYFAVRDRTLNAFALPGGFIGVNTGLLLRTDNEAQLAGVMAHETAHVMQRHIARAIQAQGRIGLTALAGLLGAVLVGAVTGSAEAVPGIIAMGQGAAMQQQINFTRMEEQEADRIGIGYLAAAGFDPNGMPEFFETMMRERGLAGADIPSMLLTHPVDSVRVAEARARVTAMPPTTRRPESESYAFIRERVRVLVAPQPAELRAYYARELAAHPDAAHLRYGAALVDYRTDNAHAAVAKFKALIAERPQLPLLYAALGQAEIAAGHTDNGVLTFEGALALSPRNVPLTVRYAEALLALNQAKKAHQILLDLFNNVAPSPEQIRLIANAASAAGDTGDAYAYMAELHLANGDLTMATSQLDLAQSAPGLTEVQRKRFLARQQEIEDVINERPRKRRSQGESGDRPKTNPPRGS